MVDGANVVGSRPDGWWRDRPGAARRLAGRLVVALVTDPGALADALDTGPDLRVHLVLEGAAATVRDLPTHPLLTVLPAAADGDSAIVELATARTAAGGAVVVVSADRDLCARARAGGARTTGPNTLLAALVPP